MKIAILIICLAYGEVEALSFLKKPVLSVSQEKIEEKIVGLAEQLKTCKDRENNKSVPSAEQICSGTVSDLQRAKARTVEDFEKTVYSWIQDMDATHPEDRYTSYLRLYGYVKGFIKALKKCGPHFVNHDAIIYDTAAVKWSEYTTFETENYEKFTELTRDIINSIQKVYKTGK